MKWLEIIELRMGGSNSELVMAELAMLTDGLKQDNNQQAVKLYVHVNIKTDFSIHLVHKTEEVKNTGSDLALNIASNLKAFGLVNHNVWLETITTSNEKEKKR